MAKDYEITKLEIAKLDMKPGDTIAIKILGSRPSDSELAHIHRVIEQALPNVKAIIYNENDIELSIVSNQKTVNQIRAEHGYSPLQSGNVYSKARPTKRALDAAIALKNWLVRLFTPRQ